MTRRDVGWLCNFTTKTGREIAKPYHYYFWELHGLLHRGDSQVKLIIPASKFPYFWLPQAIRCLRAD
jgi:hypothetical protein